jgi:hypothetical protein
MTIREIMAMAMILFLCGMGCLWLFIDINRQIKIYDEKYSQDNDGDNREEKN